MGSISSILKDMISELSSTISFLTAEDKRDYGSKGKYLLIDLRSDIAICKNVKSILKKMKNAVEKGDNKKFAKCLAQLIDKNSCTALQNVLKLNKSLWNPDNINENKTKVIESITQIVVMQLLDYFGFNQSTVDLIYDSMESKLREVIEQVIELYIASPDASNFQKNFEKIAKTIIEGSRKEPEMRHSIPLTIERTVTATPATPPNSPALRSSFNEISNSQNKDASWMSMKPTAKKVQIVSPTDDYERDHSQKGSDEEEDMKNAYDDTILTQEEVKKSATAKRTSARTTFAPIRNTNNASKKK